jgi:phosphotransferase family enzyme
MAICTAELAHLLVRYFHERTDGGGLLDLPPGVTRLTGGQNNGVYGVDTGGDRLCVKVYRADDRQRGTREWRVLCVLQSHGSSFTPTPYEIQNIDGTVVVAMEYLPGSHLGEAALSPAQQVALADRIQWLHGLPYSPKALSHGATAEERVAALRVHVGSTAPTSGETDRGLQVVSRWLDGPDVACLQQPTRCVFSRLDTSLANALWDGTTLRFVDFEYGGWLPPCLDLAEQVEHVQSRGTTDEVWCHILAGISTDDTSPERRSAAQRLLVLGWLQRFWPQGEQRRPGFAIYLSRAERLCSV